MKVIYITAVVMLILCSSCAQNPSVPDQENDTLPDNTCPIYGSKNWHAWIDQVNPATGTGRLIITGEIDVPSPGYTVEFETGPLDRRNPPSQRIRLSLSPPAGAAIQVITTDTLRYSAETSVLHYRSVIVTCGERQLAEIGDVLPTD